jgi:hypothetical protein
MCCGEINVDFGGASSAIPSNRPSTNVTKAVAMHMLIVYLTVLT